MTQIKSLDELFQEEQDRLVAEANTPERVTEDAELVKRNALRSEQDLLRLREQGMLDEDADEDEDEDEDEE